MEPDQLLLTRKQILQMHELASKFPDVEKFVLEIDNSSGIGPQLYLRFTLFGSDDNNATVDITDVTTW
jgi:hypothetical protein